MKLVDCHFFEFSLTSGDPKDIVQKALAAEGVSVVNTLNAHSFNVSLQDSEFHRALLGSDWLVADGVGVVWAVRALGTKNLRKISGFDLFLAAMEIANSRQLTVGFLGSTPESLTIIRTKSPSGANRAERGPTTIR